MGPCRAVWGSGRSGRCGRGNRLGGMGGHAQPPHCCSHRVKARNGPVLRKELRWALLLQLVAAAPHHLAAATAAVTASGLPQAGGRGLVEGTRWQAPRQHSGSRGWMLFCSEQGREDCL